MIAKYKIDGKVLILPIRGQGKSNLTFGNKYFVSIFFVQHFSGSFFSTDNVLIRVKFAPNLIEKNGKQHIQLRTNKFKLNFDTSRLHLYLENLFNGNKALGDNMNLFLNENWEIILQELQPALRETLSQILLSLINNVFDKLPYSDMFIDGQ